MLLEEGLEQCGQKLANRRSLHVERSSLEAVFRVPQRLAADPWSLRGEFKVTGLTRSGNPEPGRPMAG